VDSIFTDPEERRAIVDDVAARIGVASWVVEKDLWVCWTLARLQEVEGLPELTFKGGTSLSKVHRLVERFSEDIDLTFSREGWGFVGDRDPLTDGLSGKARERLIEEVVAKAVATVRDVVVPALRAACAPLGSGWSVDIDPNDALAVLLAYPTPTGVYGYGRPVVKAEFGARGEPWPTRARTVTSYVEEQSPGIASTSTSTVTTLEPERTFWEKATLLHALHHGTLAKPEKPVERLSRHAYDLHRMWEQPELRRTVLASPALLHAVVRNKTVFFKDPKARYDLADDFTLAATPHAVLEARLRDDYRAMREMFFPNWAVPEFDEVLASLRDVDAAVAAWRSR
jgi:hypothetical protein